ncbi:hypothetical protein GCM10028786_12330 [Flaviaesturariibacter terrae]
MLAFAGITSAFCLSEKHTATEASALDSSLWAWYSFDQDAHDLTGHGHTMRLTDGAALQPSNDCAGRSLALDGKTGVAVINDGRAFPKGEFALSFSVLAHNTSQGRVFNRADFSTAKGASLTLGFEPSFDKRLCFGVTRESNVCDAYSDLYNTNTLLSEQEVPTGEWHEIVVQTGGGVQSLYVDGKLSSERKIDQGDFSVCSEAPFYFGKWWDVDPRSFDGLLDNIRIYTRTLSEAEIDSIFRLNRSEAASFAIR